jgi:hypothetical protein
MGHIREDHGSDRGMDEGKRRDETIIGIKERKNTEEAWVSRSRESP